MLVQDSLLTHRREPVKPNKKRSAFGAPHSLVCNYLVLWCISCSLTTIKCFGDT